MHAAKVVSSCVSWEYFPARRSENVAIFGSLIAEKYVQSCLTRLLESIMALHDKNTVCTLEAVGKYFDKEQFIDVLREIMHRVSV